MTPCKVLRCLFTIANMFDLFLELTLHQIWRHIEGLWFIIFSCSLVNCACKLFQRRSTHLEKRWPSKCWSRWTSNAKCWCLWCLGGSARISEGEGFPCFLGGPVVWFDWNLRESFPVFLFDIYPIESIHGIVTYIYHQNQPNVGKYTIHGSYGYWKGVWLRHTA